MLKAAGAIVAFTLIALSAFAALAAADPAPGLERRVLRAVCESDKGGRCVVDRADLEGLAATNAELHRQLAEERARKTPGCPGAIST